MYWLFGVLFLFSTVGGARVDRCFLIDGSWHVLAPDFIGSAGYFSVVNDVLCFLVPEWVYGEAVSPHATGVEGGGDVLDGGRQWKAVWRARRWRWCRYELCFAIPSPFCCAMCVVHLFTSPACVLLFLLCVRAASRARSASSKWALRRARRRRRAGTWRALQCPAGRSCSVSLLCCPPPHLLARAIVFSRRAWLALHTTFKVGSRGGLDDGGAAGTFCSLQHPALLARCACMDLFHTSPTRLLVMMCVRAALSGAVHVAQTGAAEGCTAAAAAARYGPPPAIPSRLAAAPCVCVCCVARLITVSLVPSCCSAACWALLASCR